MRYRSYIHFHSPVDLLVTDHPCFDHAREHCQHVQSHGHTVTRYEAGLGEFIPTEHKFLPPHSIQLIHIIPHGKAQ